MKNSRSTISNRWVATKGATITIAATFVYSIIIMIYVTIRSSATIYSIMPAGERSGILLANGFSVAYAVAIFSMIMALISSIAGAITAIIFRKLVLFFNPKYQAQKAVLISSAATLSLVAVMYIVLHVLVKNRMTFQYPETFLFWFVFPAIICFVTGVIGGIALNRKIREVKSGRTG
ncbi:MAG: hypothetical protein WAU23_12415 [Ferruginibacter sp.]